MTLTRLRTLLESAEDGSVVVSELHKSVIFGDCYRIAMSAHPATNTFSVTPAEFAELQKAYERKFRK